MRERTSEGARGKFREREREIARERHGSQSETSQRARGLEREQVRVRRKGKFTKRKRDWGSNGELWKNGMEEKMCKKERGSIDEQEWFKDEEEHGNGKKNKNYLHST